MIHKTLSKSSLVVLALSKIRNQANSIIAAHLGENENSQINGEYTVAKAVAPFCRYFIDVGANRGEWTEHFLDWSPSSIKGVLFEPSHNAFQVLSKKFTDSRLSLCNIAIGDYTGTAAFIEEPDCGETSSIATTHIPCEISSIEVPISTIDAAIKCDGSTIDYLKIDAEGYDFNVLLGANRLLKARKIRFIQFEYNSSWISTGHSLRQALDYLDGFGYEVFIIRSSGLHPFSYDRWGDFFRYSNFFACMTDDHHLIADLIRHEV
jgi:FkbM family methyltransferase